MAFFVTLDQETCRQRRRCAVGGARAVGGWYQRLLLMQLICTAVSESMMG